MFERLFYLFLGYKGDFYPESVKWFAFFSFFLWVYLAF